MITVSLIWGLAIPFVLGAVAAFISQFTAAKKGLEAEAKARTLREHVNNLVERNATRRKGLQARQDILDQHVKMNIEHQKGQLDDQALQEAIKDEKQRIASLRDTITKSEVVITETRTQLAEIEQERALSGWSLRFVSSLIGGTTALIFGFIGYLGQQSGPVGTDVPLTSHVVVQSLVLGGGWPLVWEKFLAADKLESAASAAAAKFEVTIKDAEKSEV